MSIKNNFPIFLKKKLIEKYGVMPSSTMFANHFNLKSTSERTITRETARRWINGESFPQLDNFETLINLLSINHKDVQLIFSMDNVSECFSDNRTYVDNQILKSMMLIFDDLTVANKEFIILVAWALKESQSPRVITENLNAIFSRLNM
jgi:hypothetical protein